MYIKKYRNSACDNYFNGYGGYKLNNNREENACFIIKPKKCDIPILSGLIDFSLLINSCENRNNDKKSFIDYLKKFKINLNFSKDEFYFPITTEFGRENFRENVIKNIRTEKKEGINDEVSIKFKNNKGHFEINLKYNKKLVAKKRFLAKKFPVKYENIFIVYIDSLSRNHFMRKLKKN